MCTCVAAFVIDTASLNRFHTFRAVKLQPVWSYMHERCLISPKRDLQRVSPKKKNSLRILGGTSSSRKILDS
jgi:hypothetical protein